MPKINAFKKEKGWIEVISGPMFSGKSEELLRRLNLLKYADVKYLLFKPEIDNRFSEFAVKSRDGRVSEAINIRKPVDIIHYINHQKKQIQVIAIDEAQFFDNELADVCQYLANNNYIVYVCGLDCDFAGEPFEVMLKIFAYAEEIVKLKAICTECGAPASRTQRLIGKNAPNDFSSKQIIVGDIEMYTARCRHHHQVKDLNRKIFPKIKVSGK